MKQRRRSLVGAGLLGAAALAAAPLRSLAQAWPARPIRIIVPFAPGGSTDILARFLAQRLQEATRANFVVENRPGAGGTVGADAAAKAAPDGYTLFMSNNASISLGPQINKVAYHPMDDFAHLVLLGMLPNLLIVRTDHPARTFQDFIAMARAKPGVLNYSSAGVGSAGFLSGELLKQRARIDMVHIPYKGTGPATADMVAGQLDAVLDGPVAAGPYIRGGRARALAVASAERLKAYPDVPTMDEVVPGTGGEAWFGISTQSKVPREILERLQNELANAIRLPDVQAKLAELGLTPRYMVGAEYTRFIASEIVRWEPVIRSVGLKPS
ncbi:MAG: tripartite tricarboxylate transporter substrate binding protein [Burkholderiales bacterium]|nr:tripartite tricarboxylate transporter substrate binding protein [Burkholderiales bacterium]